MLDEQSSVAPMNVGVSITDLEQLLGGACLVVDEQDRVVEASPRATQLLGSTPRAVRRLLAADLLASPRRTAAPRRQRSGQGGETEKVTLKRRDGAPVPALLRAIPVELSTGKGMLWLIKPGAESRSDAAEGQMLLRSPAEFLTATAHELRTPIATILGHVENLRALAGLSDDPSATRSLAAIERQCARLQRLLEDLRGTSSLEIERIELRRQRLDLGALVERVVGEAQAMSRRHRLVVAIRSAALVEADPGRIEQVLLNLLSNAIKYSPEGGDIRVEVAVQAKKAVVSVNDQGIGIPRARKRELFKPFSRLHVGIEPAVSGMGLGLYLSRVFIARHGGRMDVQSAEGEGSTFRFSLPLAAPKRQPTTTTRKSRPPQLEG